MASLGFAGSSQEGVWMVTWVMLWDLCGPPPPLAKYNRRNEGHRSAVITQAGEHRETGQVVGALAEAGHKRSWNPTCRMIVSPALDDCFPSLGKQSSDRGKQSVIHINETYHFIPEGAKRSRGC